jgi:predicted metal-dependent hydrolase
MQLIRSDRKTISLIVERDGRPVVRAPRHAALEQILRFVEEKAGWISSRQEQARRRLAELPARRYAPGETFLYLGEPYPLEIVEGARAPLALAGGQFRLSSQDRPQAREVFTRWYRQQARSVLGERAARLAGQYGLEFKRLRISSARTRWASCSTTGTLSFTWRLIMAPLPVIDYVIVHELAHILEKNHSPRFWARVRAMLPDYPARVKWLKQNGHLLSLE